MVTPDDITPEVLVEEPEARAEEHTGYGQPPADKNDDNDNSVDEDDDSRAGINSAGFNKNVGHGVSPACPLSPAFFLSFSFGF